MSMCVEIGREIVRCERELSGLLQGDGRNEMMFELYFNACKGANHFLHRRVSEQEFNGHISTYLKQLNEVRTLVQRSDLDSKSKDYLCRYIDECIASKPQRWSP